LAWTLPALAKEGESAASRLKEAEALYAAGDFESASRGVNDLLIRDQGLSAEARGRVYLMKARLELAFGRGAEIRLWLAKAHEANPNLDLDPVKDPPQLNAVWEELKQAKGPAPAVAAQTTGGTGTLAVGLLPLGIGHFDAGRFKDGLLFASSESFFLLASTTVVEKKSDQYLLGGVSFLGIYGYELYDMLPSLASNHPEGTQSLRFGLSFLPFGVAQAKNGDSAKAFAIASIQSVLLTVAVTSEKTGQRNVGLGLFAVGWAYGILDGVSNHAERSSTAFQFQVVPTAVAGQAGALFVSTLALD
jgi:hypothetical protein